MARAAPAFPEIAFVGITIFAVANTALLNWVMASRLAYGMAQQGLLPRALGRVHPRTRTPHVAIGVLFLIVVALALAGDITALASATVLLLLVVFTTVNIALVILLRREPDRPGTFRVPILVPIAGAAVCLGMLGARLLAGRLDGARRSPRSSSPASSRSTPCCGRRSRRPLPADRRRRRRRRPRPKQAHSDRTGRVSPHDAG